MARPKLTQMKIDLGDDLTLAPPQVLGGVRLVPVLRTNAPGDLRLTRREYTEDYAAIELAGNMRYYSYVPHGLVATWTNDGSLCSTFGSQIASHTSKDGKVLQTPFVTARVMQKLCAREFRAAKNQLRFLPMGLAMEGFLAYQFDGPSVAWEEYSSFALADGLGHRSEMAIRGSWIAGLDDALRLFEIHEKQVGVLVFIADALASAFVVPNPHDYRKLHQTLLTDYYGDLLFYYGLHADENCIEPDQINGSNVDSLSDLRDGLKDLRSEWSKLSENMSQFLLGREVEARQRYAMGPFQLKSFMTDLNPKEENHIGEMVVRDDGQLEYLKTYRLSGAQCRRAFLLKQLASVGWELDALAEVLTCTKNHLVYRLQNAGFGYLLHQHVIDAMRSTKRKNQF